MANTKSAGARAEVTALKKAIAQQTKCKVVPSGNGHWRVLSPKGAVIVDENGPVQISSSPSDNRWRDITVRRLLNCNPPALKHDPWNPPKRQNDDNGNGSKSNLRDPDVQARKLAALQDAARARAERTRKIRSRLEPMIIKIGGGWDKRGFISELGLVCFHLASTRKRVENFKSLSGARQNTLSLRKGGTLSDNAALCWELLLGDLEAANRQEDGARTRYMELLREAKGLPSEPKGLRVPETEKPEPEVAPPRQIVQILPWKEVPSVALRAAILMAPASSEKERAEQLSVAEDILRLELEAAERSAT
jgi:hypothetical protein